MTGSAPSSRIGVTHGPAVVGLVGDHRQRRGGVAEQIGQDGRVVRLTAGQDEGERPAQPVDHGMDFRRPAAA